MNELENSATMNLLLPDINFFDVFELIDFFIWPYEIYPVLLYFTINIAQSLIFISTPNFLSLQKIWESRCWERLWTPPFNIQVLLVGAQQVKLRRCWSKESYKKNQFNPCKIMIQTDWDELSWNSTVVFWRCQKKWITWSCRNNCGWKNTHVLTHCVSPTILVSHI